MKKVIAIVVFVMIFLMSANDLFVQAASAPSVDKSSPNLVVVNKKTLLPASYKPAKLFVPNVPFALSNPEVHQMTPEAGKALQTMFSAARKQGIVLYARSGYRSYATQKATYDGNVRKYGRAKADTFSARPGTSEHQTGLAMDITSKSVNLDLTEAFGETKEGKWLQANAATYGFILSYPKGRTSETGYIYEPWHYRYVGVEHAKFMKRTNMLLSTYILFYGK